MLELGLGGDKTSYIVNKKSDQLYQYLIGVVYAVEVNGIFSSDMTLGVSSIDAATVLCALMRVTSIPITCV